MKNSGRRKFILVYSCPVPATLAMIVHWKTVIACRYEASDRCGKMGYEQEFLVHLEKLIRSLDRRITHGKERLRKSAEAKQKVN